MGLLAINILIASVCVATIIIGAYRYRREIGGDEFNEILIGFGMNMFRYGLNIYQQIVGNSFLHFNGRQPYDKTGTAIDNDFYNLVTLGEGYHNFHHAFPFDYRANELFSFAHITSLSNLYINVLAAFGLVYDRKFASPQMIARRVTRTGDGSHPLSELYSKQSKLWGYGDADMHPDDQEDLRNEE